MHGYKTTADRALTRKVPLVVRMLLPAPRQRTQGHSTRSRSPTDCGWLARPYLGQWLLHISQSVQMQVRVGAVAVHGQNLRRGHSCASGTRNACHFMAGTPEDFIATHVLKHIA